MNWKDTGGFRAQGLDSEHLLSCGAVVEEEVIVLIVELAGERGHRQWS